MVDDHRVYHSLRWHFGSVMVILVHRCCPLPLFLFPSACPLFSFEGGTVQSRQGRDGLAMSHLR